jgi:hypothetical protein
MDVYRGSGGIAAIIFDFDTVASCPGYFILRKVASESQPNGRVCGPPRQSVHFTDEKNLEVNPDSSFIQAVAVTVLT